MMTKTKAGAQLLFTLNNDQIAVHRSAVVDNGPAVVTEVRSGRCNSKQECDAAGGRWYIGEHELWKQCHGAKCKDSGSGDWD